MYTVYVCAFIYLFVGILYLYLLHLNHLPRRLLQIIISHVRMVQTRDFSLANIFDYGDLFVVGWDVCVPQCLCGSQRITV